MTENKKDKTVCFAYFGDGKFIGWYSDTFGTLTKNKPKLYTHSESLVDTVANNFKHNISELKEKSVIAEKSGVAELVFIDNGLNSNKKSLSQYTEVELRMTECPHYDGKNPNYNEEKYREWLNKEKAEKGNDFKYSNCPKELRDWTYADYNLVKEWALNEPTNVLQTINSK